MRRDTPWVQSSNLKVQNSTILPSNISFCQLVKGQSHSQNRPLDFVIIQVENIDNVSSLEIKEENPVCPSDHYPITFNLKTTLAEQSRKVKVIKRDYENSI